MLPELFRIPGLDWPISTYGLLLALAFIVGLWITASLAAKDGLPKERIYDLGLYILAAALIGSKLLMVATEWSSYGGDWRRAFSFDILRSGGVFYGGLISAVVVSIFLMRRYRLPWRKTADAFAPGIALGHAIGRLGCFSAGCCWGKPTTSWIGVRFGQNANEVTGVPIDSPLVPTQLIEAGTNLLIFFVLVWLRKRRSFEGQIIFTYLMIYSVARFTIEFWRGDERGSIWGLSTSQFIAVILFLLGLGLTLYHRSHNKPAAAVGQVDAGSIPSRPHARS